MIGANRVASPHTFLPAWLEDLIPSGTDAIDNADRALAVAEKFGRYMPHPGKGETELRWEVLTQLAEVDLTVARIFEAHSDALAILEEAGEVAEEGSWGVFAAEARGVSLEGRLRPDGWRLAGTKPWCSLGGKLDHALVTAQVGDSKRLFAVSLRHESVNVDENSPWVARGLRNVPSGAVHFADTPARPIGDAGWYLQRSGFSWGGIGVATCWLGGALALSRRLQVATAERDLCLVSDVLALQVGAVDAVLHTAAVALRDAAEQIDSGYAEPPDGELLTLRVRSAVATAVEQTLTCVGHALGPEPLAFDEEYARRTADLGLYVRQHHGERDLARLGGLLLERPRREF